MYVGKKESLKSLWALRFKLFCISTFHVSLCAIYNGKGLRCYINDPFKCCDDPAPLVFSITLFIHYQDQPHRGWITLSTLSDDPLLYYTITPHYTLQSPPYEIVERQMKIEMDACEHRILSDLDENSESEN